MSHVDEGLIHAWLEDQLPPDEAARVERLVATDSAWRAAAAEARGLIAATSRVIGALDSAPSAAGEIVTARTRRTGRTGASWARSPLLRLAAAVVLVAGVSGLWFSRDNGVTSAVPSEKDAMVKETKRTTVAASPTVSAQSAPNNRPRAPQVAQIPARRDSSTAGLDLGRAAVAPPAAASPPPVAAVANEVVAAAKSAATGAADATADSRGAGGGGRAGGRGGRAGRAADQAGALVEQGVVRSEFAKTLAVPDSVFRGCWIPVDASPRERRQANESAEAESMVLRFIQPMVTDLPGVRAPASANAAQTGMISALRAAPARARVQNAIPHMKDDSTVVTEWLNSDGRTTQLTFRIRGDTLRGATTTIAGALVTAGPAFIAVRAVCSQ